MRKKQAAGRRDPNTQRYRTQYCLAKKEKKNTKKENLKEVKTFTDQRAAQQQQGHETNNNCK